jgi:hypothetical protein
MADFIETDLQELNELFHNLNITPTEEELLDQAIILVNLTSKLLNLDFEKNWEKNIAENY